MKLTDVPSDASVTDALFLTPEYVVKKRSLGSMAFAVTSDFYTKVAADARYLLLTGGLVTGLIGATDTIYSKKAVAGANAYYQAGFVSQVTSGEYAAGKRPGYGFHAQSVAGAFLYLNGDLDLHLVNPAGDADRTILHSGNYNSYGVAGAGLSANQNLNTSNNVAFAQVTAPLIGNVTGNVTGTSFGGAQFMSTSHFGTYHLVNNWDGGRWYITSNHGAGVRVAYADDAGNAATVTYITSAQVFAAISGSNTGTNTLNVNVAGNSATVTNGVYTSGSYSNPSWLTAVAWYKLSGVPNLVTYGRTSDLHAISANTFITGNSTASNSPGGTTWFNGIVFAPNDDADYKKILGFDFAGNLWKQSQHAGTWGSWTRIVQNDGDTYAISVSGNAATVTTLTSGQIFTAITGSNSGSNTLNVNVSGNAGTITSQANSATITASYAATPSYIAQRDSTGNIAFAYINLNSGNPDEVGFGGFVGFDSSSGASFLRRYSQSTIRTALGLGSMAYEATSYFYTKTDADARYAYIGGSNATAGSTWAINVTGNAATVTTITSAQIFSAITGSNTGTNTLGVNISGNAATVSNGVYTTTFNTLGDARYLQLTGGVVIGRIVNTYGASALADGSYGSGNIELQVSSAQYTAGARPGIGLHAVGQYAGYFYMDSYGVYKTREATGGSYTFIHSGNYNSYAVAGAGFSANQNLNTSNGVTFNTVFATTSYGGNSGVSWGSIKVTGSNGSYAGINFSDVGRILMWSSTVQGSYTGSTWQWYFNNGSLQAGTVPAASIETGTANISILGNSATVTSITSAQIFSAITGSVTGSNSLNVNILGNSATATNMAWSGLTSKPGATNWASIGNTAVVVDMLSWKNYGNGHVLFDASAATSPSGASISRGIPQNRATSSGTQSWGEPITLMGWNGANTFGVRVDWANSSETSNYSTYLWATTHAGSYYMYNYWTGSVWRVLSNHGSPMSVYGYAELETLSTVVARGNSTSTAIIGTGGFYTNGEWFRSTGLTGIFNGTYSTHFYSDSNGMYTVAGTGASSGGIKMMASHNSTLKGYLHWNSDGVGLLNDQAGWSVRVFQGASYGGQLYGNWLIGTATGASSSPTKLTFTNDYSNGTTGDKLKIYLYNGGSTQYYGFGVGGNSDMQYHAGVGGKHHFYINDSVVGGFINTDFFIANYFYMNGKRTIDSYDNYLRINQNGDYAYGIYTPGVFRSDGGISIRVNATSPSSAFHIRQFSGDGYNSGIKIERESSTSTWSIVQGGDNNLYMGHASTPGGSPSVNGIVLTPAGLLTVGNVTANSLAGTGTRMVTVDGSGNFGYQTIPSGGGGSGSYTPSATNLVNCSSLSFNNFTYIDTGSAVSVSGSISVPVTTAPSVVTFDLNVPVGTPSGISGVITGSPYSYSAHIVYQASGKARVQFTPSGSGSQIIAIMFMYFY